MTGTYRKTLFPISTDKYWRGHLRSSAQSCRLPDESKLSIIFLTHFGPALNQYVHKQLAWEKTIPNFTKWNYKKIVLHCAQETQQKKTAEINHFQITIFESL